MNLDKHYVLLTHANTKDQHYWDLTKVCGWGFSTAHQCTHIVLDGGAMTPVSEAPEVITKAKKAWLLETRKEK